MTIVGEPGVWDEEAFQKALQRIKDPEERTAIEAQLRADKELLLRLAKR